MFVINVVHVIAQNWSFVSRLCSKVLIVTFRPLYRCGQEARWCQLVACQYKLRTANTMVGDIGLLFLRPQRFQNMLRKPDAVPSRARTPEGRVCSLNDGDWNATITANDNATHIDTASGYHRLMKTKSTTVETSRLTPILHNRETNDEFWVLIWNQML